MRWLLNHYSLMCCAENNKDTVNFHVSHSFTSSPFLFKKKKAEKYIEKQRYNLSFSLQDKSVYLQSFMFISKWYPTLHSSHLLPHKRACFCCFFILFVNSCSASPPPPPLTRANIVRLLFMTSFASSVNNITTKFSY